MSSHPHFSDSETRAVGLKGFLKLPQFISGRAETRTLRAWLPSPQALSPGRTPQGGRGQSTEPHSAQESWGIQDPLAQRPEAPRVQVPSPSSPTDTLHTQRHTPLLIVPLSHPRTHVHVDTRMAHTCTHLHTCSTHARRHAHTVHACASAQMQVCGQTRVHMHMHTCALPRAQMHAHMRVHTHTRVSLAPGTGCRKPSAAQAFFTSAFPKFALRKLRQPPGSPSLSRAPDHIPSLPSFSGTWRTMTKIREQGTQST